MKWTSFHSMMQSCSEELLRKIASAVNSTIANSAPAPKIAAFVFGSAARYESLPMSDVDIIILSSGRENNAYRFRRDILANINTRYFDKVDCPYWETVDDIKPYIAGDTPESYHLDMKFVAGNKDLCCKLEHQGVPSFFYSPQELLGKIVFEFSFLRTRYKYQHSIQPGNTKYSEGAMRDLLFIDWVYRYITAIGADIYFPRTGTPEILSAIKSFSLFFRWDNDYERRIISSLDNLCLIRTVYQLHFADGNLRGRPHVTHENCTPVFDHFHDLLTKRGIQSPPDIVMWFRNSCRDLCSLKEFLYRFCVAQVEKELLHIPKRELPRLFSSLSYPARSYVAWQVSNGTRQAYLDFLNMINRHTYEYRVEAALLSSVYAPTNYINKIAESLSHSIGNEYILRVIAKHPNTSKCALMKLQSCPCLAVSKEVDQRYRQLISDRLTSSQNGSNLNNRSQPL